MDKRRFVLVLALAGVATTGSAVGAQKAEDACALLTSAEIQPLEGNAKVGNGVPSTDALGSRNCQYKWGAGGNVQGGAFFLQVTVAEIAKVFPGIRSSHC